MLTFGDAQGDDEENSLTHMDHGFHSKLPPGILPHGLPTVKEVAPAITPQEKKDNKEEKKEGKRENVLTYNFLNCFAYNFIVVELSEEQKQMIILSEEFQKFVIKSGRIIERALTESVDIYTDYIGGGDNDDALYVKLSNCYFIELIMNLVFGIFQR